MTAKSRIIDSDEVQASLSVLASALAKYRELADQAREMTNAKNRQNTVVKDALSDLRRHFDWQPDDKIQLGEFALSYCAVDREVLLPETVLEMYERGEITREQFTSAISVGVTDAKKYLGADVFEKHKVVQKGAKADTRLSEAEKGGSSEIMIVPGCVPVKTQRAVQREKATPSPRRSTTAPQQAPASRVLVAPPRRMIPPGVRKI